MNSFESVSPTLYRDWNSSSILDSQGYLLMEQISEEVPGLEVREEQVDCLDAIQLARAEGRDRALVQMATGLGKTTVIAADVKRFFADKPGSRVLFLCHQNRILDQARERFASIVGPEYTYGTFTGESQDYHEVDCLFASFQAMEEWRDAFLEDEFDYIVVDESHHSKAPTYEKTLKYFKPSFLLGVTGTPDRHDLQDIRDIFGPEQYAMTLEEAIADERLTRTDYHVIIDAIEAERKLKDLEGKKYNIRQLNHNIFVPMRDEEMARICREKEEDLNSPVRRLVFCSSIEQTEEFAQYFEDAAPIHAKLPKWEVKQSLDKFRSGEIKTLLTVDMFNEGIDVPEINQVVFLRITQSKTIFLQQLGRGLRKIAGKDKVQVLDFVANADRLIMLDKFWKRIQYYGKTKENQADVFRINIAETQFNDTLRDVLYILSEIETRSRFVGSWTEQDSIYYYHKLRSELGRHPTKDDLNNASKGKKGPNGDIVLRPFDGKISLLKEAAGISTFIKWSGAKSIKYYLKVKEELGRHPTAEELQDRAHHQLSPSFDIIVRPFNGRISALRVAAGFFSSEDTWTIDETISFYQQLTSKLGRIPTIKDLNVEHEADRMPPVQKVLRKFDGKISGLRRASDLPEFASKLAMQTEESTSERQDRPQTRFTNRMLFDNISSLAVELGREPTTDDIDISSRERGTPSSSTYRHYFGSWYNALRHFRSQNN